MCAAPCAGAPNARSWRSGEVETINEAPRQYVNRLSDLLFVLARVLNRADGGTDVLWQHERSAG